MKYKGVFFVIIGVLVFSITFAMTLFIADYQQPRATDDWGSGVPRVAPLIAGAYQEPPATIEWEPGVPNYNSAANIHPGTIDLSNWVCGDFRGVSSTQPNVVSWADWGAAIGWDDNPTGGTQVGDPNTNGDFLDGKMIVLGTWPVDSPHIPGWWELPFETNKVYVQLTQDHGPYLAEALEIRVYGSNTLWGGVSSQAVLTDVYLDGWRTHNPTEDINGNGWCSDDVAAVFELPGIYRYVKLTAWEEPNVFTSYWEPEVDAVLATEIPAPPTPTPTPCPPGKPPCSAYPYTYAVPAG